MPRKGGLPFGTLWRPSEVAFGVARRLCRLPAAHTLLSGRLWTGGYGVLVAPCSVTGDPETFPWARALGYRTVPRRTRFTTANRIMAPSNERNNEGRLKLL
jgi:hypothetical protein